MSVRKNRLDGFMNAAIKMITVVEGDAGIKKKLDRSGCGIDMIEKGKALYEEARELIAGYEKNSAEQAVASCSVESSWDNALNLYLRALKAVRIVYKNNEDAYRALVLKGERCKTLEGWMEQAEAFYSGMIKDPGMVSDMSRFGYSAEKLRHEYDIIIDVSARLAGQKKLISAVQEFRSRRDAKINELDVWLADFRKSALKAFSKEPQMLETLGIAKDKKKKS